VQRGPTRAVREGSADVPELNTRQDLIETMRALRAEIEQFVADAGPERAVTPHQFGEWSLKDVIAHLTSWRLRTAARLEAALHGTEPASPWPEYLNEDEHTDEINAWFYEQNRDKSLATVLEESRATFDRVERAISALPEEDLFQADRFPWLHGYILGPGVIGGTYEHHTVDHAPEIRAWLAEARDNG
jgi:hypothetical protein